MNHVVKQLIKEFLINKDGLNADLIDPQYALEIEEQATELTNLLAPHLKTHI